MFIIIKQIEVKISTNFLLGSFFAKIYIKKIIADRIYTNPKTMKKAKEKSEFGKMIQIKLIICKINGGKVIAIIIKIKGFINCFLEKKVFSENVANPMIPKEMIIAAMLIKCFIYLR